MYKPGSVDPGDEDADKSRPRKSMGRTPKGVVFEIPITHDVISGLFDPRVKKSSVDFFILGSLAMQCIAFMVLPKATARYAFMLYFCLWRLAYNGGLGYVLRKQSASHWLVRKALQGGWLDETVSPKLASWIRSTLEIRMGPDYSWQAMPLEFNLWLAFRHAVDVILLNDFTAYCFCAFSWYNHDLVVQRSTTFNVVRWAFGTALIVFNIVVKADAHRVVKDYAWYWGDAFFSSLQTLIFDGVFEMAPHPMYSVGYAGYYGLSLIIGSQAIFFVSLAAHLSQFVFLIWFENPHIARIYGESRPLADLQPLQNPLENAMSKQDGDPDSNELETPSQTADDSETEDDTSVATAAGIGHDFDRKYLPSQYVSRLENPATRRTTKNDFHNRYFYKDLLIIKNWDIFRCRDFAVALSATYAIGFLFLPSLGPRWRVAVSFGHAFLWRIFHTFFLGIILKKQSANKWLVRHFVKHYYYENERIFGPVDDTFRNWSGLYNLSLTMTYISFAGLAWNAYGWPTDWTPAFETLRHTFGVLLIALHIWTAKETFEVLGSAGWFYADFFLEDYPKTLYYTGIYRFLNNPERIMGGAAFFGLSLLSGSGLVAFLAIISVLSHLWFLKEVENPHMRKLYGNAIRKDSGLTKTIRSATLNNVPKPPEKVQQKIRDFTGSVEKVLEETAGVLEEFIARPKMAEYVADTRVLLRQSHQRLSIIRMSGTDGIDASRYCLELHPKQSAWGSRMRFHLGESISVRWTAPVSHARSDWIGIYPVAANTSREHTRTVSHGRWTGIIQDEWKGDLHEPTPALEERGGETNESAQISGIVKFSRERLPHTVGLWELRYHHAGQHSVLDILGPLEIYVNAPRNADNMADVYSTLGSILRHCLDIHSLPTSCLNELERESTAGKSGSRLDEDDFVLYTEDQARLIAYSIKQSCQIDLASEVIVASSNVMDLSRRVVEARKLLMPQQ